MKFFKKIMDLLLYAVGLKAIHYITWNESQSIIFCLFGIAWTVVYIIYFVVPATMMQHERTYHSARW